MSPISFAGQAVIVTGAAGGIGRAVALELARRGADLLVNDYGGDTAGGGGGAAPVETLGAELRALGVRVIADATPVGEPDAARHLVQRALETFGRLDALASIAGTALPGLITDHVDSAVESQFRTNLLGPFALMRAVWPTMRDQGYGRILHTSSNAAFGIGANASYATTKAGLIGLTLDAAMEGRAHGIHVNAMMPVAYSRMIEQIPDPAYVDWFRRNFPAARVASAAALLLSRDCNITGRVLDVGGGQVARIAFTQGEGWFDVNLSAESLRTHLNEALDMASARIIDGQPESMRTYSERFPFAREGAPTLSREAVVGAGQRQT